MMPRPPWWPMLVASVQQHEGLRLLLYQDTVGKWSIGYGRNLQDNGIRLSEAEGLLANDLDAARWELHTTWPWTQHMSGPRQAVLTEMLFNLGRPRLLEFARMKDALMRGDYLRAAQEMRASRWALQVGQRAETLAARMERG